MITSAAPSEADGNNAYEKDLSSSLSYQHLFMKYGFSPKHVSVHIDNYGRAANIETSEGKYNLELIQKADVIFFNGGDQARHSRSWLDDEGSPNELFQYIVKRKNDDSAIFAGTSAGTMIMSNQMYGGGISYGHLYFSLSVGLAQKKVSDGGVNGTGLSDTRNGTKGIQYEDNGGMMPGFGFVDMLIDTHFDARGRLGRMMAGLLQTKKEMGVGIDESTCLFFDNGVGKVFGSNGVFIVDVSRIVVNPRLKYFNLKGAIVSHLTIGDKFIFHDKTVISSKELIKSPAYSGYRDSTNIFEEYECTLLSERLVDQTGKYNIGRSRIPSGYEGSAPKFGLTFYVTDRSKGYYS